MPLTFPSKTQNYGDIQLQSCWSSGKHQLHTFSKAMFGNVKNSFVAGLLIIEGFMKKTKHFQTVQRSWKTMQNSVFVRLFCSFTEAYPMCQLEHSFQMWNKSAVTNEGWHLHCNMNSSCLNFCFGLKKWIEGEFIHKRGTSGGMGSSDMLREFCWVAWIVWMLLVLSIVSGRIPKENV